MKFFPADWRSDPALRICSVAARGLWIDMLCIMHEAEPYGYLNVKGVPLDVRALARMVGLGLQECRKLLKELEKNGVFSCEFSEKNEPIIFSRRMVADHAKALKDKENGRGGGNPALTKGVNPPDKAHKPEARIQSPESSPSVEDRAAAKPDRKAVPAFIDRMLQQFPDLNAAAASGGLLVPTEINLWVAKGFDLEQDIEPAVVGYLSRPNRRAPRSWSFFANIVAEFREKRLTMPEAALAPAKTFTRLNPDGSLKPDPDGVLRLHRPNYTGGGFREFEPDNHVEEAYLIRQVRKFHQDGAWNAESLGPPPGHPACLMPDRVLAGAALPVPEGLNGTGSTARH